MPELSLTQAQYECLVEDMAKKVKLGASSPGVHFGNERWHLYQQIHQQLLRVGSVTPKKIVVTEDMPTTNRITAGPLVLCGQHPSYTGKRKPRTQCRGCNTAYERLRRA